MLGQIESICIQLRYLCLTVENCCGFKKHHQLYTLQVISISLIFCFSLSLRGINHQIILTLFLLYIFDFKHSCRHCYLQNSVSNWWWRKLDTTIILFYFIFMLPLGLANIIINQPFLWKLLYVSNITVDIKWKIRTTVCNGSTTSQQVFSYHHFIFGYKVSYSLMREKIRIRQSKVISILMKECFTLQNKIDYWPELIQ